MRRPLIVECFHCISNRSGFFCFTTLGIVYICSPRSICWVPTEPLYHSNVALCYFDTTSLNQVWLVRRESVKGLFAIRRDATGMVIGCCPQNVALQEESSNLREQVAAQKEKISKAVAHMRSLKAVRRNKYSLLCFFLYLFLYDFCYFIIVCGPRRRMNGARELCG